jgi:starvation-inducible outer membrane lipoprotein
MAQIVWPVFRCECAAMALITTLTLVGCSNVPRRYLLMAERDTTLTTLTTNPDRYDRKVVVLGGTMIEEEVLEGYQLLRIKNRPLDQDYVPHRPPVLDGPEAGYYWLMVGKGQLPPSYRHWARMTVVGRVIGKQRQTEPVLSIIYVRGWGVSGAHDGIWEHADPNYLPSIPGGLTH